MKTLKLKAPAKINLYLNVLNKRSDGYHNIETIFEKIDLCDEIILRKRKEGIGLSCSGRALPQDIKKNLAFRAARALLKEANCTNGAEITLRKRIPVAAGLGGGSSDAASVLLGLNKLLELGLSLKRLKGIASDLGADIPFFILPNLRAIGRGKGELLTPLPLRKRGWYLLVIPRLKVSTRRMYQEPRITLTRRPGGAKIVLRALEKGDLTSLNKYTYNSFEPTLEKRYKQILEIKKALKSCGVCVTLMSGSGPCVFGICASRKEAIKASSKLRAKAKKWQLIVVGTYIDAKSQKSAKAQK